MYWIEPSAPPRPGLQQVVKPSPSDGENVITGLRRNGAGLLAGEAASAGAGNSLSGGAVVAAGDLDHRRDAGFEGVGKGGPGGEQAGQIRGIRQVFSKSAKKSAKVGGRVFASACGGWWLRRGHTGFRDRSHQPLGHLSRCRFRS